MRITPPHEKVNRTDALAHSFEELKSAYKTEFWEEMDSSWRMYPVRKRRNLDNMVKDNMEAFRRKLETERPGKIAQIRICYINAFRMFFQHRSWMVLPMTAVLSLVAGLAVRDGFLKTLDGTMTGAFVLVGVCIWNGSFSSIQAICREREIIRNKVALNLSALSYTLGNMLFQFLVCLAETGIMLLMLRLVGIRYTGHPLITGWFVLDFGITVFLILYASDMVALFISAICRTKTAAMTILPFVLVLQLVFSGSIISIPDSIDPIAMITVSRPGFKAMAAQTDLNNLPIGIVDDIVLEMEDTEISAEITLGQVMDILGNKDNPAVQKARAVKVGGYRTIGELVREVMEDDRFKGLRDTSIIGGLTVGVLIEEMDEAGVFDDYKDKLVGMEVTVGEVADMLASNKQLSGFRNEGIRIHTTVGDVLELLGREKMLNLAQEKASSKYYNPGFEHTSGNVAADWTRLIVLLLFFAVGTIIALEIVGVWSKRSAHE